jgi:arylsulfatase A-like enzyme
MKQIKWIFLLHFLAFTAFAQKNDKPNVIIVITDDQGYGDVGAHGNNVIKTPALDDFYKKAVRLTDFHVSPTCAPTRAALLTGNYANRTGVWHTIGGVSILREDEKTLAELLKEKGYQTGLFGKWHLGDNFPSRPHDKGFDTAVYHGGGGVGQTPDYWGNDYFDDTYFLNGVPTKYEGYCTDVWFDEAIKFIESKKNAPFFCYISTNAPHSPLNVPKEYYDAYKEIDIPEYQKKFYGMITNIDDNFNRLVKYLKKRNLYDNTILIFMTDNGTSPWGYNERNGKKIGFNASMRGIKGSEYEGGHRVPFLISFPKGNITGGKNIEELTAHIDVVPTIASMCGANINQNSVDGLDISGLLNGSQTSLNREYIVTDSQRVQAPVKWRKSAVMSRKYRLINGKELYNIKDDPSQEIDLAQINPEQVEKMRTYYNQWWASVSSKFNLFPVIKVGSHHENPTVLTGHDYHVEDSKNPWNQNHIRKAETNPANGSFTVEFIENGNYQIELSRWPFESSLAISSGLSDGSPSTLTRESIPDGNPTHFASAILKIGGWMEEKAVKPSDNSVKFNGYFSKGKTDLIASFTKPDGSIWGAYYVKIKRL